MIKTKYLAVGQDELSSNEKLLNQSSSTQNLTDNYNTERFLPKSSIEKQLQRWKLIAIASSSLLVSLIVFSFMITLASSIGKAKTPSIFSPAEAAIGWEKVVFHNNFHEDTTPYQGPPNDDVDARWLELYSEIGIVQINGDDAAKLPNRTLPIPGEDNSYIVGLEVFHSLHCLNSIRKALYPDHYHEREGLTGTALLEYDIHIAHCVDSIRQSIQCYSDVATIPWIINPYHHYPAPDAHTTHVCRNFGQLQEWARERAITQDQYDAKLNAQREEYLERIKNEGWLL